MSKGVAAFPRDRLTCQTLRYWLEWTQCSGAAPEAGITVSSLMVLGSEGESRVPGTSIFNLGS